MLQSWGAIWWSGAVSQPRSQVLSSPWGQEQEPKQVHGSSLHCISKAVVVVQQGAMAMAASGKEGGNPELMAQQITLGYC